MGTDSGVYKAVLVAHILCAIVGFGVIFLNGVSAREAQRRSGSAGLAVSEANLKVTEVGQYFVYAVFVLGFALVGLSDSAWRFGQTWIWLATLLYLGGVAVWHAGMMPATRRMVAVQRELAASAAVGGETGVAESCSSGGPDELVALARRVTATSAVVDVLLVAILALMVWKPGA